MSEPTIEELRFLAPRLSNRWWRLNNLYWIKNAHGQVVKFRPNWAQRAFYAAMWWLNEVLKVRQIGISTFIGILWLDRALFNGAQACGIIDRTDAEAVKKLAKIKFTYEQLDNPADPRTAPLGQKIKEAVRLDRSNDHLLQFSNDSQIWAGVTLRGDTINALHVSEFGYIAAEDPKRAAEIASGSFNTVHAGNMIVVEATHEGGRGGAHYELIRAAEKNNGKSADQLTTLDFRFHFFPWWREASYTLPLLPGIPLTITPDEQRYFDELEATTGVKLTPEQKHWWIKKSRMPKVDMARQYPGTVEEALSALVEGAIYGKEMQRLRAAGRVRDFVPDGTAALFTFWDLGVSDYVAVWFMQFVGLDILVWDYYTAQGDTVAMTLGACQERERSFGRPIRRHFVPHDANNKMLNGATYVQAMQTAGVGNVTVVPRTPDVWVGIKHARTLLPRCYFHALNCNREITLDTGRILPSGLAALEGYQAKIDVGAGALKEMPVHNQFSHGADGFRTFSEAHLRGMLEGFSTTEREHRRGSVPQAITGLRQPDVLGSTRIKVLR